LVKEQDLKIKAEEAETLRNCEALETKENLTQLFPLVFFLVNGEGLINFGFRRLIC
jgi:hypothetical protein